MYIYQPCHLPLSLSLLPSVEVSQPVTVLWLYRSGEHFALTEQFCRFTAKYHLNMPVKNAAVVLLYAVMHHNSAD